MRISTWKNKKVAIVGLGVEGISSAKFFLQNGALVTILEKKRKDDLDREFLNQIGLLDVSCVFGETYLENLLAFSLIVRSPGIKLDIPEFLEAKEKGIPITSQTKLFFDVCPCPIIGVTGTKGKGTTSSLIYEMCKAQGMDVYLGGNIGKPPFSFLDNLTTQSLVVLELSSFQLQDMTKSPHVAVMLMVTSEHLDYHGDTYEYIDAKRNILRFQTSADISILNRDYLATNESDVYTDGHIFYVSREREVQGDGCFVRENKIIIKHDGQEKEITTTENILLPGKHNLENVCAAIMAASVQGVSREHIVEVLKTFKGLSHRLQLIGEINEVQYVDDSFSTTPETAIAAIEAFTNPEILILGGSSKNADFSELGTAIMHAKNIKAIIGIGEEWEKIKKTITTLKSTIILLEGAKDMKTVVQAASKIAAPHDVILLSPACASFGMFKNYKDRGEQFQKEVAKLQIT